MILQIYSRVHIHAENKRTLNKISWEKKTNITFLQYKSAEIFFEHLKKMNKHYQWIKHFQIYFTMCDIYHLWYQLLFYGCASWLYLVWHSKQLGFWEPKSIHCTMMPINAVNDPITKAKHILCEFLFFIFIKCSEVISHKQECIFQWALSQMWYRFYTTVQEIRSYYKVSYVLDTILSVSPAKIVPNKETHLCVSEQHWSVSWICLWMNRVSQWFYRPFIKTVTGFLSKWISHLN